MYLFSINHIFTMCEYLYVVGSIHSLIFKVILMVSYSEVQGVFVVSVFLLFVGEINEYF